MRARIIGGYRMTFENRIKKEVEKLSDENFELKNEIEKLKKDNKTIENFEIETRELKFKIKRLKERIDFLNYNNSKIIKILQD